ncbi:MAG: Inner membrane protein YrbG [Microgenomates bacterium OLB23]|nr:MAG: Inner membrane protein YrbG [Microgenomates bacterium OLB23]
MLLPALFTLDRRVTNFEGAMLVVSYAILLVVVQRKKGIFDHTDIAFNQLTSSLLGDFAKIIMGAVVVFVSSSYIVHITMYFADVFRISAFYIGLLVIAVGTNLPELSVALRAVHSGNKDVAMGDYIGSAAVNTFLFGLFTLSHNGEVITVSNFMVTFIFIAVSSWFFLLLFVFSPVYFTVKWVGYGWAVCAFYITGTYAIKVPNVKML